MEYFNAYTDGPRFTRNFGKNVQEVRRLVQIHEHLTGTGPGRRHDVQVLHKSAIVLLVACWEAVVEDMVQRSVEIMVRGRPASLPEWLRLKVARELGINRSWELAGIGWKTVMRDNLKGVIARSIQALNTPKTEHVNGLFRNAVGLENVSRSWSWSGMSADKAEVKLDELVVLRGSIAHRVASNETIGKHDVERSIDFVMRLTAATANAVREHLSQGSGSEPWPFLAVIRASQATKKRV